MEDIREGGGGAFELALRAGRQSKTGLSGSRRSGWAEENGPKLGLRKGQMFGLQPRAQEEAMGLFWGWSGMPG